MDQITNVLYWLSTGLLVPVILSLLYFFANSLYMLGVFYRVSIKRSKVNYKIHCDVDKISVTEFLISLPENKKHIIYKYLNKIKANSSNDPMLDKIVGDYEVFSDKDLGKSKLLVKIGPMLGLMGTLIPMGPALVGLATGDVASMANNMQVAFSTTVVGIIIGLVGFITLQVKQRWIADDLNLLEYIVESLKTKKQ